MAVKSLSVEPAMDAVFFEVKAEAEVVVFFELSDAVDARDWDWDWDWDGAEPVVAMAQPRDGSERNKKDARGSRTRDTERASFEGGQRAMGEPNNLTLTTKLVVRKK